MVSGFGHCNVTRCFVASLMGVYNMVYLNQRNRASIKGGKEARKRRRCDSFKYASYRQ